MTILQRIWKATEVERWGIKEWWKESEWGFIVAGLGIIVLPFFIVACWAYAAHEIFVALFG